MGLENINRLSVIPAAAGTLGTMGTAVGGGVWVPRLPSGPLVQPRHCARIEPVLRTLDKWIRGSETPAVSSETKQQPQKGLPLSPPEEAGLGCWWGWGGLPPWAASRQLPCLPAQAPLFLGPPTEGSSRIFSHSRGLPDLCPRVTHRGPRPAPLWNTVINKAV